MNWCKKQTGRCYLQWILYYDVSFGAKINRILYSKAHWHNLKGKWESWGQTQERSREIVIGVIIIIKMDKRKHQAGPDKVLLLCKSCTVGPASVYIPMFCSVVSGVWLLSETYILYPVLHHSPWCGSVDCEWYIHCWLYPSFKHICDPAGDVYLSIPCRGSSTMCISVTFRLACSNTNMCRGWIKLSCSTLANHGVAQQL